MRLFRLSDGRIILTNDLWHDTRTGDYGWVESVPPDALIGHPLPTRTCQLKTKASVSALVKLVTVTPIGGNDISIFEIEKDCLSAKEAYELHNKHELPTITPRQYKGRTVSASFASCEGALLSHIKVGRSAVEPLDQLSQLSDADPGVEPVFLLYSESSVVASGFGLQAGDRIDETYVYGKLDWTDGAYSTSATDDDPPKNQSDDDDDSYRDYFDYYDNDRDEFTPSSGWYSTGNGDQVYAFRGEEPDLTACDSECGYCGRCTY